MFGQGWGNKGAAFEFFSIFLTKFLTLGTTKLFKFDKICPSKPQLGAKFVVKIPREGTDKLSKCHTYASTPRIRLIPAILFFFSMV